MTEPDKTKTEELKSDIDKDIPDEFIDYDVKHFDSPANRVIKFELDRINEIRKRDKDSERGTTQDCIGLALSGGGIRSSTFSLGVMQALARKEYLKNVDYLSTVSGGGYIGSSLTWLLSQNEYTTQDGTSYPINLSSKNFPYGTRLPGKPDGGALWQNAILRYLRQHGKYLTPGKGITIFSFAAVFLRGLLLNLIVYLPLIVLLFYLLNQLGCFGIPPLEPPASSSNILGWLVTDNCLLFFSFLLVALFVFIVMAYSLTAFFSRYWGKSSENNNSLWYQMRRRFERLTGLGLNVTALLLILGLIPMIHKIITDGFEGDGQKEFITGMVSFVTGIASGVGAYLKSGEKGKGKVPLGVWVWSGALLILFGLFYMGFFASLWVQVPLNHFFDLENRWLWLLFIVPLVVGIFTNMNYISVHRYYRDRLMETFMPKVKQVKNAKVQRSQRADGALLSQLKEKRPYHLVNTNVVLVDSDIAKFKGRGGDNFILSPLYCGSNATGWRHTTSFMGDTMTLPTAMAISGAALNPSTGVGGEGVTRNQLFSIVMTLLNLRLGFWGSNPGNPVPFNWPANFFIPCPFFRMNEDHRYIQLTDGGHFENLALYELIRRRLKVIIVCDGGADPFFKFEDLGNLAEKVRVDFGTQLKIDTAPIIPKKSENPSDQTASQGHTIGKIIYPSGETGALIYLKTTFIEKLDQDVVAYKNSHPEFPDESTADQFFDEKQFEAYRQLGYQIALKMIKETKKDVSEKAEEPYKAIAGSNLFTESP